MLSRHVPVRRIFRFLQTNSGGISINPREMCHMLAIGVFNGIATTYVYPAFSAIRLRRIEMWAGGPAPGNQVTIGIQITRTTLVNNYNFDQEIEDTSVTASEPCHVVWRPRRGDALAQWVSKDDASYAYSINGVAGTLVELEVDGILQMNTSIVAAFTSTTVFPAYPSLGLGPLDMDTASGGRLLQPVTKTDIIYG